jgi:hypothetical protein
MKRKNKDKRLCKRPAKQKITEKIWEFAGGFIRVGATPEQRQMRLTAAVCAWNIASSPAERRQTLLDRLMLEYLRFNPHTDPADSIAMRSDMEKLVQRKLELFPLDLRQIVNARLIPMDDKDRIEAVAATFR